MDYTTNAYRQRRHHAIPVTPIEEALNRDVTTLEVPKEQELLLSPFNAEHHKYFARVNIGSYRDKQNLGFIPRGLAEESARDAIAKDNDETLKLVSRMAERLPQSKCRCEGSQDAYQPAFGTTLKRTYNDVRTSYHPALAKVMGEHYKQTIAWDSPVLRLVKFWTEATATYKDVYLSLFKDIIINEGATLLLDKSTQTLYAGNIAIHKTGRLVCGGGYIKIWAHSVTRLFSTLTTTENIFPWKLNKT